MDLKEFTIKYSNTEFTFSNWCKNTATYRATLPNKKLIVTGITDYRSDLNITETLNSLDCELEITSVEEV